MVVDHEHKQRWRSKPGGNKGGRKKEKRGGGEEVKKDKESKKSRIKMKTPESDRRDGNGLGSIESLIRGFRENKSGKLDDMKRQGSG